jgi:uncharacterized lipoprotein NlpE involved in copper resistance
MKARWVLAVSAVGVLLGGCANSNRDGLVGTWTGRAGPGDAPFTFGSVSFVGDNTFTAEARYGGNVRVQSGTWQTSGDMLVLHSDSTDRQYKYKVSNGELAVTDPQSGNSITLDRLKK